MVIVVLPAREYPCMESLPLYRHRRARCRNRRKTQLCPFYWLRATSPWPIILGIFVATVANHALAGAVGA